MDDEANGAILCENVDEDGCEGKMLEGPRGIDEAPRGGEVEEDCNGAPDPADSDGDNPDGETPADVKDD